MVKTIVAKYEASVVPSSFLGVDSLKFSVSLWKMIEIINPVVLLGFNKVPPLTIDCLIDGVVCFGSDTEYL